MAKKRSKNFSKIFQSTDESLLNSVNQLHDENSEIIENLENINVKAGKFVDSLEKGIVAAGNQQEESNKGTSKAKKVTDNDQEIRGLKDWFAKSFSVRNIVGVREGSGTMADKFFSYMEKMDRNLKERERSFITPKRTTTTFQESSENIEEEAEAKKTAQRTEERENEILDELTKEVKDLRKDTNEIAGGKGFSLGTAILSALLLGKGLGSVAGGLAGAFSGFLLKTVPSILGKLAGTVVGMFSGTALASLLSGSGAIIKGIGALIVKIITGAIASLGAVGIGALAGAVGFAAIQLSEDYKEGRQTLDEFESIDKKIESGQPISTEESKKWNEFKEAESMGKAPGRQENVKRVTKSTIDRDTAKATLDALESNKVEDIDWGGKNLEEFGISYEALKAYYEAQYGKNATDETRKAIPTLSAAQNSVTGTFQQLPGDKTPIIGDNKEPQRISNPNESSVNFSEFDFKKNNPEAWKEFDKFRNDREASIIEARRKELEESGVSGRDLMRKMRTVKMSAETQALQEAINKFKDQIKSTEPVSAPSVPIAEPTKLPTGNTNTRFSEEDLKRNDPERWKQFSEYRDSRKADIIEARRKELEESGISGRELMRKMRTVSMSAETQALREAIQKYSPESTRSSLEIVPKTTGDNIHKASNEVDEKKLSKSSNPIVVSAPSNTNIGSGSKVVTPPAKPRNDDSSMERYLDKTYGF